MCVKNVNDPFISFEYPSFLLLFVAFVAFVAFAALKTH